MYSKQEAAQLKQRFWTSFGQYMQPVLSAEGEYINWINYKTGEKDIYFRMRADNKQTYIAIELTHKDAVVQSLYYEQFKQMQSMLHDALSEEWIWQLHVHDEHGKPISRIYKELNCIGIFKKDNWPQMISFFKPRIIALDNFWSSAKYVFEALR